MATKKKAAAPAKDDAAKAAEKKAKQATRKEKMANMPEGQRQNSRSFDVIELPNGGKVMNYAYPVRKYGVVITSVAYDKDGNVISTSVTHLPGYSVKSKKGHGNLVPKVPGVGKKGKGEEADDEPEEENED